MKKIILSMMMIFTINGFADTASNKAFVQSMYDTYQSGTAKEFTGKYTSVLADDYQRWNGRYVGLGFRTSEDGMTVLGTTNSPAADHLKAGDVFVSVNGVMAGPDAELPFKGAIGGDVNIVLKRDGKEMKISMKRAAQENTSDKDQMMTWMSDWDEENWSKRSKIITMNPVIAEGNEVWGSFESMDTNDEGNEVRWWTVERFQFNDKGQLSNHGDMQEDMFIAEQNGYSLLKE
jgi:hypothetical protein